MQTLQITVEELSTRFLRHSRGVIHVGANVGQEARLYDQRGLPVIWIEPIDGVFDTLKSNIATYMNQRALKALITDEDGGEYNFGISNNGGQSSSIYDLALHRDIWPNVHYQDSVWIKSVTLKTLIEREHIDLKQFDALVIDVQGAELLVLKGLGDLLPHFKWIRAEAADFELYRGSCLLKDLDEYVLAQGFERHQLFPGVTKEGIGTTYEVLYRRRDAKAIG